MSIKSKIINNIAEEPKFVTFGFTFTIAFVIGTAIGLFNPGQAFSANTGNNDLAQQGIFRTQGGK